jgi:hypothetical protein
LGRHAGEGNRRRGRRGGGPRLDRPRPRCARGGGRRRSDRLSRPAPAEARRLLADLFDAAFYRGEAGLAADDDAFAHYLAQGARAHLRANPVFDPAWYVARAPEARDDPLLHYALIGEAEGRDPSPLFDVNWYRRTYAAERPLAHYLAHRFGPYSPVPEFDAVYYLQANPDVAAARMDPFLHYLHFGFREFRKPRGDFNPRLYARRFLRGDAGVNPLVHQRLTPAAAPPARRPGPHEDIRRFSHRGPRYEELALPAPAPRALALAFHLTQYHRIPENDAWWGEGFTEWTSLARGVPRFAGHYQPRIPGALGFYDLSEPQTLRAQARLARAAGIGGFVFYSYDFDGRRLLDKPLELFLDTPDIDIGFCLMWANENWTRRWDGAEDEVLLAQSYAETSEGPRVADWLRHFRDPRYIRLQGRPLLMVYRASLIPGAAEALARWRRLCAAEGEDPVFVMAQTFDDIDPRPLGFDAAIEFPPHKLTRGLRQVYESLDIFDEDFEADAFAYDDVVAASLAEPAPEFPLIKTAAPSWDNDARRQGRGLTLVGATPLKFERWLAELIDRAHPLLGARIVAINAWNEWSEGAYLEPDVHQGYACLNAAARAISGAPTPQTAPAAAVSAFVVHGGGPMPPLRLRSLFAQTHPMAEIVVLDAGEHSLETVEAEAQAAGRDVALGLGIEDALRAAADMASGEFVWIVESQGLSDPAALAALARALAADPLAAFSFCESGAADAQGRRIYARLSPLSAPAPRARFTDGPVTGADLAGLAHDPPRWGAMLWRRSALAGGANAGELIAAVAAGPSPRAVYVAETLDFFVSS